MFKLRDNAPQTIAQGTAITSATSAFVTGIYGAWKGNGRYVGILAASAALNSGITAATFFTIREYLVSPILVSTLSTSQYLRRKNVLELTSGNSEPSGASSWSELRMHKLLDTGISGAAAGGILNGWRAGSRGIAPGIATGALACVFLQLAYNEINIAKVKYIYQSLRDSQTSPREDLHSTKRLQSSVEHVIPFLGLQKLSDEDYLKKLKSTRDGYIERIKQLERIAQKQENKRPVDADSYTSPRT